MGQGQLEKLCEAHFQRIIGVSFFSVRGTREQRYLGWLASSIGESRIMGSKPGPVLR